MELIRGIDTSLPRRMIVEGVVRMATKMGIVVIAEGIETISEYNILAGFGVRYMQGYLFARPEMQQLPKIVMRYDECEAAMARVA